MFYKEIIPDIQLRQYIACYWMIITEDANDYNPDFLLPDTVNHLVLDFGTSNMHSYIIGSLTRVLQVEKTNTKHCLFGIKFRPCGYYALFNNSPKDIADTVADHPFNKLYQSIENTLTPLNIDELVTIINRALLQKIKQAHSADQRIIYAADLLDTGKGAIRITDVAQRCCLSIRQFERLFSEQVGITAKKYAQVKRFNNFISLLSEQPDQSLQQLAYHAGYYDHAHLAHDFTKITGLPPAEFTRQYKMSHLYTDQAI